MDPAEVEIESAPQEEYRLLLQKVWEDAVLTTEESKELKDARDQFGLQILESESIEREQKLHRLLQELKVLDASIHEGVIDNGLVLSYQEVVFARFVLQMGRVYLYLKGDEILVNEVPYPLERTTDMLKQEFPLRVDLDQVSEMDNIVKVVECCLAVAREESGPLASLKEILARLAMETDLEFLHHPSETVNSMSFCLPASHAVATRYRFKSVVGIPEGQWTVRFLGVLTTDTADDLDRLEEAGFQRLGPETIDDQKLAALNNLLETGYQSHPVIDLESVRLAGNEVPGIIVRTAKLLELLKTEHQPISVPKTEEREREQKAVEPINQAAVVAATSPENPEDKYCKAIARAWEDDVLTRAEADFLTDLHRRLGLSEVKALSINRSFVFKKIQSDLLGLLKYAVFCRKAHPSSGTSLFTGRIFDREFMLVEISGKTLSFYVLGASPPWKPVWEGIKPVRETEPGRFWYRIPLSAIHEMSQVRQLFKRSYLMALGDVAEELLSLPETGGALSGAVEYLRSVQDYQLSPRFIDAWMKLLEGDPRFKEDEGSLVLDM